MEFEKLKKALADEAEAAGICAEWHEKILQASTKERLIALYFAGYDFVEENDYPTDQLLRAFGETLRENNIYDGDEFDVKNPRRLVAYKGAQGVAKYDCFAVGQLWVKKGARAKIIASDSAFVTVDVGSGADVEIKATGQARVIVYIHTNGKLNHESKDNAVIKIKNR